MGQCRSAEIAEVHRNILPKPPLAKRGTLFPPSVPTLKYASREDIHSIYKFTKYIGQGQFGEVSEVISLIDNQKYAVKTIQIGSESMNRLENEIYTLRKMDHPNIIKFYETYTDGGVKLHIVTELCTGGDIFEKLVKRGKFTEEEAAPLMYQVLSTVAYLHKSNYCHRDLKPENFLYKSDDPDSEIKLIDFGLASRFSNPKSLMTTIAGSPYYVAPEVLSGMYTISCDIWSVGIIMYVLLSGEAPLEGCTTNEILNNLTDKGVKIKQELLAHVSEEGRIFISKMLNPIPSKRPSAEMCIKDDWFKKFTLSRHLSVNGSIVGIVSTFKRLNSFKKVIYSIFPRFTPQEHFKKIVHQFKSIDANNNGLIPIDSFISELRANGLEIDDNDIPTLKDNLDFNKDGYINFSEFLGATLNPYNPLFVSLVDDTFKYLDVEHKEAISLNDFLVAFKREANIYTPLELRELWKSLGKEPGSMLSKEEYKTLMLSN